jgi:hypothetical protein
MIYIFVEINSCKLTSRPKQLIAVNIDGNKEKKIFCRLKNAILKKILYRIWI